MEIDAHADELSRSDMLHLGMSGDDTPARRPLGRARELTISALSDRFADGEIDLEEFEDRLDRAHAARDVEELDSLVADLGLAEVREASLPQPAPPRALANRPDRKTMVSILSERRRDGAWRPPENLRVMTFLGSTTIDFRDVALPAGVTELRIASVLGRVELIVPPGLAIECEGMAILGQVEELHRMPPTPEPERPLLRVSGMFMLGQLEITTRLPGETRRAARRRERAEAGDRRIAARKRRQLRE
jgi:hypothetical protein